MGNFLSDVGRSTLSSSVRDLIQSKISLDANERAGQQLGMQQALNAEQLKVLQRQNKAAADLEAEGNKPIPVNAYKHLMVDRGEGPITDFVLKKATALGYIDNSNPENPTFLKKYVMPGGEILKMMESDAPQLNSMGISWANKEIIEAKSVLSEKPNDKAAMQRLDAAQALLTTFTHTGAQLEAEKIKSQDERAKLSAQEATARAKYSADEATERALAVAGMRNSNADSQKNFVEYVLPDKSVISIRSNEAPPAGARRIYSTSSVGTKYVDEQGNALVYNKIKGVLEPAEVASGGKPQAGPTKLPAEQQASFTRFQTLDKTVDELRESFKTSYVGPLTGRVRGVSSQIVNDPEFVKFKNKLGQLRTIVYAESGKQINESELKWLDREILPKLYQPDKNFNATLDVFQEWLNTKTGMLKEAYGQQNVIVGDATKGSKKSPAAPIAPQAAIDFLKANPTPEVKRDFKAKYGSLPEGF